MTMNDRQYIEKPGQIGPMKVTFKTRDIVDEQVEGLVCSGNVWLNMSGGVNGELLRRGGKEMQRSLYSYLKRIKPDGEKVEIPKTT